MIAVLHRHVPPHEAQIMAGALCGAGFHAHVLDFHAAHLYGALVFRGCRVVVNEEEVEEAHAFLQATPDDEAHESDQPAESCPEDGNPPGFGVLLFSAFGMVMLTSLALAVFLTLAYVPLVYMVVAIPLLFLGMVPPLLPPFLIVAILAGLLLLILRGYRAGWFFCRVIVSLTLILLAMGIVMASLG